jgi:hypothetical protein
MDVQILRLSDLDGWDSKTSSSSLIVLLQHHWNALLINSQVVIQFYKVSAKAHMLRGRYILGCHRTFGDNWLEIAAAI